jgi:hypothetical protein
MYSFCAVSIIQDGTTEVVPGHKAVASFGWLEPETKSRAFVLARDRKQE